MVVPYSSAPHYPTINQLAAESGMATAGGSSYSSNVTAAADGAAAQWATPQERFLHLLQQAERRHQEAVQRALRAETQIQQLRRVFQQWQQQLQVQRQHQQMQEQQQQAQVQRQMQSLYDMLLQQQTTACWSQRTQEQQLDEMSTFQQLQAFAQQQQMGHLQEQLVSVTRHLRAERRSRQVLQRQVGQPRPRRCPRQPPPPSAKSCWQKGDCCPCELPEECPFNPCMPDEEECCETEIPEGPEGYSCFLRDMRLGYAQPLPCAACKSQCPKRKPRRKPVHFYEESESGYAADDEASLYSTVCSSKSSAFKEERRQRLQEVRSLDNTRLAPRYKEVWKPLRCFVCGGLDHLATVCSSPITTVL